MEDGASLMAVRKVDFENFTIDGNKAVQFKLVRDVHDLEKDGTVFFPDMCHQIFGEGESIFGYENLTISLYFTAGSLKTFIGIDYSRRLDANLCDGVDPDNVIEKLETVIPLGYMSNMDVFSALVETEAASFIPPGELIHSFQTLDASLDGNSERNLNIGQSSQENTFEVYLADGTTPKFTEYHHRMESFSLWYINGASLIDASDLRWKFFTLFQKYSTSDGDKRFAFVGFAAIYEFYNFPDKIRPRVAQMLILPPFQKKGLGVELLCCVYNQYRGSDRVVEITVEDPSDAFECLRDFVEARDCMALPSFSPENLIQGFNNEMLNEGHRKLKIIKRQVRRIYELLKLRHTNVNNVTEFNAYKAEVKARLNKPYEKQKADVERMLRRNPNQVDLQNAAALDDATQETELESNFQNALAHYKSILRRLDRFESKCLQPRLELGIGQLLFSKSHLFAPQF